MFAIHAVQTGFKHPVLQLLSSASAFPQLKSETTFKFSRQVVQTTHAFPSIHTVKTALKQAAIDET